MSCYQFWIDVHALPTDPFPQTVIDLGGEKFQALRVPPGDAGMPLEVSFEAAHDALARLERMFIEPDGSFVWRGHDDHDSERPDSSWQVDGLLIDRGQRLAYVELKGTCPAAQFDRLLRTLGWPDTQLMFQWVREAVFLDEAEFRRYAVAQRLA